MENNLEIALAMYRKGDVTPYIIEKALGETLEGNVKISGSRNNTTSFGIFAVPDPESLSQILYFVDIERLTLLFDDETIIKMLQAINAKRISLLSKISKFSNLNKYNEKTFSNIISFLFSLYDNYRVDLAKYNSTWLPEDEKILSLASETNIDTGYDIEALVVGGILPAEVEEFVKENLVSGIRIEMVKSDKELPVHNLFYRIAIENVTSTFGERDHKQIPYDYLPKTNQ